MADEILTKIFRYNESTISSPTKYGYKFFEANDYFKLAIKPFDLIHINFANKKDYYYKVEGIEDNKPANIRLEYKNKIYYFNDESNIIDISIYEDISKFKLYINDEYIRNSLQSGEYGELFGNVNISECNVPDVDELVVYCFRNDDKRLIGEYPIVNGIYRIPNLDANARYDIVLVDKNRTIEQQVLSYRLPAKY